MKTLIKTQDIRTAYRVAIWLLLSNNIAGIALNTKIFGLSLLVMYGIPGAGFAIHYFISALKKEPVMYPLIHVAALLYNVFIWLIFKDISDAIIGGEIWPIVNIILSAFAITFSSIHFFIKPNNNEN